MTRPVTIAMWSGPRNISTAMMYSFGNRPDCFVWDEPFYAFSLLTHGNNHPMREEIIAAYDSNWESLVASCLAAAPQGKTVFYQKHMTHHMLKGFDRAWVLRLTNAFLIRRPERVLASYTKKWSDVTLRDIGFVEQAEIFDVVADHLGRAPAVVDADDVLADPRGTLTRLCESCGIAFVEHMLSWPKGPKSFDGVWAPHWYNAVWESTGFAKPQTRAVELNTALARIADEARPFYEHLRKHKL
ncbi:hypothetical protein [Taklimakanibacter deserti]|uniref:sulfotransferase-like domain-containing protein n=1 Tax=Taklimakanibacter deserti TaxID=2267839 RepID=UPI0034D7B49C